MRQFFQYKSGYRRECDGENISFEDYISLLKKEPNANIEQHEIYKEYQKKIKSKNDKEFWNLLLDKELDKLYYFILVIIIF